MINKSLKRKNTYNGNQNIFLNRKANNNKYAKNKKEKDKNKLPPRTSLKTLRSTFY